MSRNRKYAGSSAERNLAAVKAYQARNYAAHLARCAVYKAAHPMPRDVANRYKARAYATNPEKFRARCRAWVATHPGKVREMNSRWRKEHPDLVRESTARYRAARHERIPAWITDEQITELRAIYETAARMTQETGESWHVDHIIPIRGRRVSGLHVPSNLQIIRASDNHRKSNSFHPDAVAHPGENFLAATI